MAPLRFSDPQLPETAAPMNLHAKNTRIDVKTRCPAEMVAITRQVQAAMPPTFTGACLLFCMHTTAGLTINENADPDVVHDMLAELDRLVPCHNPAFRHAEGNSAAHVKSSLMGSNLTVPVENGQLLLGTWQGIYFCEFDGPRNRHVSIRLLVAAEASP